MIKKESGDAFDFAVICTALLRAAEVPAYTDGGVLVNPDLSTQSHWWCEFYIDKIGWIPCDPALGAGLEFKQWSDSDVVDVKEYYFGNMDSHHILFSRGWSQLKPFSADNKIVQQPRSFALQSIWEEANRDILLIRYQRPHADDIRLQPRRHRKLPSRISREEDSEG